MKKFLLFLLVNIAIVGFATSANFLKRCSEIEGETFTVLSSKTYTYTGWFGIKWERCLMTASTPSSSNIYHFDVTKTKALPTGKTFIMSFGRIKVVGAPPTTTE